MSAHNAAHRDPTGRRGCCRSNKAPPRRYTLSGPYSSNNLSLFLVHRDQSDPAANYLTLQEAMRQMKVIVDETGHVNVLTIENRGSGDVFIHSGEIVKGGRQDRTIAE